MEEFIKESGGYIVIALLAIALAFTLGYESGSQNQTIRTIILPQSQLSLNNSQETVNATPVFEKLSIILPGVDQEKRGATANLDVEKRSGTGRLYIDIDEGSPFVGNETQNSIRTAIRVAKLFDEAAASTIATSDLFYSLKAKTLEVGGSSAGAAITIATIALLEGKAINESVAISGTINPDGSIGPVGEILEKARALKKKGIVTFLIPVGESTQETSVVNENQTCTEEIVNGAVFRNCRLTQTNEIITVNIANETNMNIIEVPNIRVAFEHMVIATS
ncbi:MAG: S16 family serine protease [Candidatus Micrarchaeota archaeon]